MNKGVLLLITFAIAIFSGCSCHTDVANGTGSNAGETELASTIVVTTANGTPLSRATARLWTMDEDTIKVEWSDTLDDAGTLMFNTSLSGQHLLETHSGDSLSAMRWVDFGKQPSQTLAADACVSLKGKILYREEPLAGIHINILDKVATTGQSGEFQVDCLPEGVHYAYVEGYFGKFTYQMQTGMDNAGTTNNIDIADSVFSVIEDFEKWGRRQTMIGKSFGQGWWFICTDSLQGGGSHMSGGIKDSNILVTGESAKTGSSLHIIFDLDEEYSGHYGVAGFTIGDDFDEARTHTAETFGLFDLRAATAISFDAKGTGELFLQITKRGSGDSSNVREYHKTLPTPLESEWKHYTFTAEDFDTELYEINSLNFMVEEDAEIYLDNIRLDGISPAMWPSLGIDF